MAQVSISYLPDFLPYDFGFKVNFIYVMSKMIVPYGFWKGYNIANFVLEENEFVLKFSWLYFGGLK